MNQSIEQTHVYDVYAKDPNAAQPFFHGKFLDDDWQGAVAQAKAFLKPSDESTQFLVMPYKSK